MEKNNFGMKRQPYEYADLSNRYSQLYGNDNSQLCDYGTGELYTFVEVHTVTLIEDNPGITGSEIAERNCRTKGAVSQILSKLESKDLIRRERDPNNGRRSHLYVTEKGLALSRKHKEYDEVAMGNYLHDVTTIFGREAVEKFYEIMEFAVARRKALLEKED